MYTGIAEVEIYLRKIREVLFYKKIVNVDVKENNINIEKDIFENALNRQMFIYINRKSDIINLTTGNAVNFMVKLGFNGRMYFAEKGEDYKKDYILKLEFLDGKTFYITGDDKTFIEIVAEEERKKYLEDLKVDPLDEKFSMDALNKLMMEFDGNILEALISEKEIKGLILDTLEIFFLLQNRFCQRSRKLKYERGKQSFSMLFRMLYRVPGWKW
jgi:formamidopyrimidine-DNA glycosylase